MKFRLSEGLIYRIRGTVESHRAVKNLNPDNAVFIGRHAHIHSWLNLYIARAYGFAAPCHKQVSLSLIFDVESVAVGGTGHAAEDSPDEATKGHV